MDAPKRGASTEEARSMPGATAMRGASMTWTLRDMLSRAPACGQETRKGQAVVPGSAVARNEHVAADGKAH